MDHHIAQHPHNGFFRGRDVLLLRRVAAQRRNRQHRAQRGEPHDRARRGAAGGKSMTIGVVLVVFPEN